jgi:hypothetical protein
MINEYGAVVECKLPEETLKKNSGEPLCPPQIPHHLGWDQTILAFAWQDHKKLSQYSQCLSSDLNWAPDKNKDTKPICLVKLCEGKCFYQPSGNLEHGNSTSLWNTGNFLHGVTSQKIMLYISIYIRKNQTSHQRLNSAIWAAGSERVKLEVQYT